MAAIASWSARGSEDGEVGFPRWRASSFVVTNVAQFRSVPSEAFLGRCAFRLEGMVTLVDTNRNLLVVQDETGAVALNPSGGLREFGDLVGQRIRVECARCCPSVIGFPAYPYRPSTRDVQSSFEIPSDLGEYYLTRMRGFLHPPVSGDYTFWIASDNSSELWLSPNDDPTQMKKLAFQSPYSWVEPREWSRFPWQRSETVHLRAGQRYYIEALQEQSTGDGHLAVAWRGPSLPQSVIDGDHLTPWIEPGDPESLMATNGILREYWTNFCSGALAILSGPRPFQSQLSVDGLRVTPQGEGNWPQPRSIASAAELRPEDDYAWTEARGDVTFVGENGGAGYLELSSGQARLRVCVMHCEPASLRRFQNASVQVQGVLECGHDESGALVPGLIWAPTDRDISLTEGTRTSSTFLAEEQPSGLDATNGSPEMGGFYSMRGVVTFNDRVLGKDCMFVQQEAAAVAVSLEGRNFVNRFGVGRVIELGGSMRPGKNIPTIHPLVIREFGWRPMPAPLVHPMDSSAPGAADGRWVEVEGVVHKINPDRTVVLVGTEGPLSLWIGKAAKKALGDYVDAKLRVRGVYSLAVRDAPLLLVPSQAFVDVEEAAPGEPFALPTSSVSNLFGNMAEMAMPHRVKLVGNVTFAGGRSFFVQDASGGIRVHPADGRVLPVGQSAEVVGFPIVNGSVWSLTEALVRPLDGRRELQPQKLDAGAGMSFGHAGALIQVRANLIAQRIEGGSQVLELQEKQRVFEAELPLERLRLPSFAPGSRLQVSGVCDFGGGTPALAGNDRTESPSTGALKLWLRTPADVVLLRGPPWWTWKRTALLVGALLTVLAASLLRIHLLRRRLARQLAFSRQILESQESERHRIAANLHDSLGQNLLVIKNQARLAMQPSADETALRQRLDEISGCASQAIVEVREITHALRPYQLDRLGLTQAIRASVNRAAENSETLFASHADDIDGLFDKESEIHVYRIVQEAVANILKHSAATEATVVVKKLAGAVALSIRDNGRGFDAGVLNTSASHDVGHGLRGMHERVRIMNGTFEIDSSPGQGTTLSIEIPVPVPDHEE